MNKLLILGIAATLGAARLAFFPANPPVDLQPTSPGTAQSGHLNITGTATVGLLKSQGTVFGASTATTGFAYGGFFTAASDQGRGFYGFASSPTGLTYGGFFQNASDSGRAVFGLATATSGFNYGGYFQSASTTGRGVLGVGAATSGVNYGVYGTTASPDGYGVYSEGNMKASGVIYGNGSGLTSVNASTLSGIYASGFYVKGYSVLVDGVFNNAVYGKSTYGSGTGVRGYASATSGSNYGVHGQSDSTGGIGVYGRATASTGTTTGVYARNDSTSGRAMVAVSSPTSGDTRGLVVNGYSGAGRVIECTAYSTSGAPYALLSTTQAPAGYGVFGQSLATSGVGYGTVGRGDSPSGWGLFSAGRFGSTGTKSFRIDHPFDPEHKYLLHYSSESPSPQNFYSGNIVTDERGYAWVVLPEYFEEINKNYKYQLTVVDDGDSTGFVMAKVSRVISGNKFQIRTSEPRATVSWRVEADRNDLYVRNRPTTDVEEKVGREIGTYQHPEFYGKPADRGLFYDAAQPQGTAASRGRVSDPRPTQMKK